MVRKREGSAVSNPVLQHSSHETEPLPHRRRLRLTSKPSRREGQGGNDLGDVASLEAGVKCFKCTVMPPSPYTNETTRLCSHFDWSDHYIVDCPYSTLCMKKHFSINLTGTINGTVRDCAHQRYDYQTYKDGKWQMEVSVEEPYKEGCAFVNDKGQKISKTEYCYCRGDLCNHSGVPILPLKWMLPVIYLIRKLS